MSGKILPGESTSCLSLLLMVGLASLGYAIQSSTYLNHDVAWVLWGARAMLHGAVFGRDIIEPNPPLIWYLSLPPVWVAETFSWPIDAVYRLSVLLLGALSLLCTDRRLAGFATPGTRLSLIAAGSCVFMLLVGRDFGQREHVAVMLTLPYIAGAAIRLADKEPFGSTLPAYAVLGLAAGLAAAISFAIKPYFYAVPLLLEGAIFLRHRRLGQHFRPEVLAIPLVALLYLGAILFLARPYLDVAMPLAMSIYWSFNVPLGNVILPIVLPASALILCFAIMIRQAMPSLPMALVLSGTGYLIAQLVQMKGYTYHGYPVIACTLLAFATLLPTIAPRRPEFRLVMIVPALVVAVGIYGALLWWLDANRYSGGTGREIKAMIAAVEAQSLAHAGVDISPSEAGKGGFLAISTHPLPGFPTALYTSAPWTSRTNSQWFLPAVVAFREGRVSPDPGLSAAAERNARDFILHDLGARPWIVFVDTGPDRHAMAGSNFDFIDFYEEDPAFRTLWQSYRESTMIGRFRVFLRDQEKAK